MVFIFLLIACEFYGIAALCLIYLHWGILTLYLAGEDILQMAFEIFLQHQTRM
jgi:hypothetical protein